MGQGVCVCVCVVSANKNTATSLNQDFRFSGKKQRLPIHPSDKVPLLPAQEEEEGALGQRGFSVLVWGSGWAAACCRDGLVFSGGDWSRDAVAFAGSARCSYRVAVRPWSFPAEEGGWPGSWGPNGALLLSVGLGRVRLLESSPAEGAVKPSKSFPSDTPINSVKEWSSRMSVVCSTVTSLGQNPRAGGPFLLEQASCPEHEPVLQRAVEFFSGVLWDDGLPLAKALFSLSGTIVILSFTKPLSSSVNSLFEDGRKSCTNDGPGCSLASASFAGRAS